MSYQHGGRGAPQQMIDGPIPGASPPGCFETGRNDCWAGAAETQTTPVIQYTLLDCRGPDSTQRLMQPMRAMMIEPCRVWFNLPDQAVLPSNNTLFLCFDSLKGGNVEMNTAQTKTDHVTNTDFSQIPDPTQMQVGSALTRLVMPLPLGNVTAGSNVLIKNDCRVKFNFATPVSLSELRVTIRDFAGNVFLGLAGERVFVEFFTWCEKRI